MTTVAVPTTAAAAIELMELNNSEVVIEQQESRAVRVENASGETMKVFDLTGKCVLETRITNASQKVELSALTKGCYIVKVGNVVRKIFVK